MSSRTEDLFRLLADGRLHSGTELAARLKLTRSAVWKRIRQLEACGVNVVHEARKGYRLARAVEPLQPEYLQREISLCVPQAMVRVAWHCASTNTEARRWLERTGNPAVVLTECQSAGRGRRGRSWHGQPGASLLLSISQQTTQPMQALQALSLQLGLACVHTLWRQGFGQTRLKWPNDLVVTQTGRLHKLGGLLVELSGEVEGPVQVTVGLGLNLQLSPLPPTGPGLPAANLADQAPISRNRLAVALVRALLEVLKQAGQEDFSGQVQAYDQAHALHDQPVRVLLGEKHLQGRVAGVNAQGCLLLQSGANVLTLPAGEVSVRPHEDAAD